MTLDHLSFGTHNIAATTAFYEGQLGFPVLIHERMLMQEGGTVEHVFFDCGINRGLGMPRGTIHFALRRDSLGALEERRLELIPAGVVVGDLLDLIPTDRSSSTTR